MKNKLEALRENQHEEWRVHGEGAALSEQRLRLLCQEGKQEWLSNTPARQGQERQDQLREGDSDVTALPLFQTFCTSDQSCLLPSPAWKAEKESRILGVLFPPGGISPAPGWIQEKVI